MQSCEHDALTDAALATAEHAGVGPARPEGLRPLPARLHGSRRVEFTEYVPVTRRLPPVEESTHNAKGKVLVRALTVALAKARELGAAERAIIFTEPRELRLEREIKDLDRQIKEARGGAMTALTLEEKLAGQEQIRALESLRHEKRRSLFEAQDPVDRQRDGLIASIEGKLSQCAQVQPIFTLRWRLQ